MTDFPKIRELPSVLKTDGWEWEQFSTPSNPSYDFWVGTDAHGIKWLTKLKGGFSGYREIVFARLAQEMDWSCQTSVFALFDKDSQEQLSIENGNNIHAVQYFMNEHSHERCTENCPHQILREPISTIKSLKGIPIKNILDWPKSDIAACIFGAGEQSGVFFTDSHNFVIIDSEQMFSCGPGNLNQTAWDKGCIDPELQKLKVETCKEIQNLSNKTIQKSLNVPEKVNFEMPWSISDRIKSSRVMVNNYLQDRS